MTSRSKSTACWVIRWPGTSTGMPGGYGHTTSQAILPTASASGSTWGGALMYASRGAMTCSHADHTSCQHRLSPSPLLSTSTPHPCNATVLADTSANAETRASMSRCVVPIVTTKARALCVASSGKTPYRWLRRASVERPWRRRPSTRTVTRIASKSTPAASSASTAPRLASLELRKESRVKTWMPGMAASRRRADSARSMAASSIVRPAVDMIWWRAASRDASRTAEGDEECNKRSAEASAGRGTREPRR
mmetsp:Transcript_17826/g.30734  ORF Transcript_17826/g.30734 Transcript_17826/m.30734 type:complete len:251 (-) Transcript_17826:779-1531(-)